MAEDPDPAQDPYAALPLSPWARRFRYDQQGRELLLVDSELHSGLAPEAPALHPKYYADTPAPEGQPTTKVQLDKIFSSERMQRDYFRGLESWQTGSLMRYVWFSDNTGPFSGGHLEADYDLVDGSRPADVALQVFHSERIQVDESKWLGFLKRDRWYDTGGRGPTLAGGSWSIDNPRVWEVLSISIELLDRIIKALIADKHVMLETILFGMMADWKQINPHLKSPFRDANILFSQPFLKRYCDNMGFRFTTGFVAQLDRGAWIGRLNSLLKDQAWGLTDSYSFDDGVWAVTLTTERGIILLDVGPLKTLMGTDLTLAERCIMQFIVTTTMLHELFHSLHLARKLDSTWPPNAPSINVLKSLNLHEPLVDDDGATEIGFAAEQRILGGQFYIGHRAVRDIPFGLYRQNWPEAWEADYGTEDTIPGHRSFRRGAMMEITRVPALHAAKLLSAAFWEDATIARKSDGHFHLNRLIISDTRYLGRGVLYDFAPARVNPAPPPPARLSPGEAEMMTHWRERHRDWEQRRDGWYKSAGKAWDTTPWAMYQRRQDLHAFARGFAARDELRCRLIARRFVRYLNWTADRDRYVSKLPPTSTTHYWLIHAIGLLMHAALPIRVDTLTRARSQAIATWRFIPGRAMAAAAATTATGTRTGTGGQQQQQQKQKQQRQHRSGTVETTVREADEADVPAGRRSVGPSVLYDPLGRPGHADVDAADIAHAHYLDVLARLLAHLAAAGAAVPAPWLRELTRAAADLRRQRSPPNDNNGGGDDGDGGDGGDGGGDATPPPDPRSWAASWSFAVPEYEEGDSRFENGSWTDI
ncbi:hypothetical protein SAMD00023353_0701440 [Rosellinia necatrix]|uniref:Uncharacterized protein n=1 Tax=Rosellinia necatrix TaxID=77044 RepID=A0A1S7ULW3_ROSNE|nr:hypothetical protein SAMD00023353_0701440 [Rosellinia necatrix]